MPRLEIERPALEVLLAKPAAPRAGDEVGALAVGELRDRLRLAAPEHGDEEPAGHGNRDADVRSRHQVYLSPAKSAFTARCRIRATAQTFVRMSE